MAEYKGNPDFRGWLAVHDPHTLEYTGNDGKIDWNKVNSRGADTKWHSYDKGHAGTVQEYIDGLHRDYQDWDARRHNGNVQQGGTSNWGGGYSRGRSGGGGGGGMSAVQRQAIDKQWAQNNKYYNDMLGSIDPRRNTAQAAVDRQVDTSINSLKGERDSAFQNLDRQDQKLEKSYALSKQSLGEMVRNTLQGESNNIGMLGGGNSSAIGMLGVGVADLQNSEQGKMLDDLNEQKTDIEVNRQQVQRKLEDEVRKLNDFRQSKYQEIHDTFNEQRNEILNKMNMNDNQRAQALAQVGAISTAQIQDVDRAINGRLGQIVQTYQNITAPQASLASVPAYQAKNITQGTVDSSNINSPSLTPGQATESVLGRRPDDDDSYFMRPRRTTDDVQF